MASVYISIREREKPHSATTENDKKRVFHRMMVMRRRVMMMMMVGIINEAKTEDMYDD
jgi:hypothetical protein